MIIRPATPQDQAAILGLVHSERLNPHHLYWPYFWLAADSERLLGAVQLRAHADGSRELGSLVVRQDARGKGIAAQLIDALLAAHPERVFMITGARFAAYYRRRWGFQRIAAAAAPFTIGRNYAAGLLFGGANALLRLRPVQRLVVLVRHTRQAW